MKDQRSDEPQTLFRPRPDELRANGSHRTLRPETEDGEGDADPRLGSRNTAGAHVGAHGRAVVVSRENGCSARRFRKPRGTMGESGPLGPSLDPVRRGAVSFLCAAKTSRGWSIYYVGNIS
jgi:hypothetical protein